MIETVRVTIPKPHPAQRRALDADARFTVLNWGRRSGKTEICEHQVAKTVLAHENGKPLGLPVAWFAPTYPNMLEEWARLKTMLAPVLVSSSRADWRMTVVGGGVVEFWSLASEKIADSVRGRRYALAVVEEAASVPNLLSIFNKVVYPTLGDFGGRAWFPSTPKGMNDFHTLYKRGLSDERPDWYSQHETSACNPHVPPWWVEAERDLTEAEYAQEVLAQFVADGGSVFRRVKAAATAPELDAPEDGHRYAMGVDWAQSQDWTVATVIDLETGAVVAIDRFNQISYDVQLDRVTALANRFDVIAIIPERNSMGQPLVEALAARNLPVLPWTMTNASKASAVQALALAFERGDITIPNREDLLGELQAFASKRLPSGLMRYEAPSGAHDDMVVSLMLAWQACINTPKGDLYR